ncbi:DEAD/DEAH box helicase [Sorangium sp. So ce381]|uniref:DEAD/DEAH box helicase n=1 Tax=Sorangium sp. So ce381 TaxID=3133307 RepID=UPI003F5C46E0
MQYFMDTAVNILTNSKLRKPQLEAYIKIQEYFTRCPQGEALVVLPTGTGKTGLVSIAPFGVSQGRVLIVTPGLVTKQSIRKTQESLQDNFWVNFDVIFDPDHLPIVNEYHSDISDAHLTSSHIVYSNIHKINRSSSRGLLSRVKRDFFDMVIIDEAHHAPADSWREVLAYFSSAKKLHVTGTPYRGDSQEIPGERIHETPLSEVMRDRYVKWLRKETTNAHELYFTIPEQPGRKFSKDEVLELKDREWIEKSVALAESCSQDVIQHSIRKLREFQATSPKVPHKVLAIGCSIAHANDLCTWYKQAGLESVIVHSDMSEDELTSSFRAIDTHSCQVVISVNMLMEGYDHQYLSTLAIFRPYRSLNAFAQVVGRVLRAIPNDEITAFEVDNNAVVVYHEEIGLDAMWKIFQKEVERAKRSRMGEHVISDAEYTERDNTLASVRSDAAFVSTADSYLVDIDFNEMFATARRQIEIEADAEIQKLRGAGVTEETLEALKVTLIKKSTTKAALLIDPRLMEKRPALARKQMRELLTKKIEDEATSLLSDCGISEKGTELVRKFRKVVHNLNEQSQNDATLVRYINAKLYEKFGPVKDRDNAVLLQSINTVTKIVAELRKILP